MKTQNKFNILLVDDHVMFQEALGKIVKTVPGVNKVFGVSSANQALEALKAEHWDLILLDIEMPQLDGMTFLRNLKQQEVQIDTIILTTHKRDDLVRQAVSLGAKGYVLKESDIGELKFAIQSVLEGGIFFTESIQTIVFNETVSNGVFRSNMPVLSSRELEVLKLIAEQKTGKEIADALNISLPTVSTHRANLLKKTKCVNMAGLTRFAIDHGFHR